MSKTDDQGQQTKAVYTSKELNHTHAVSPPIWLTTTFSAESAEHFYEMATVPRHAEFYTRYGNPTHQQVEATLAALEGGEAALVTSSGIGAIFPAVMCQLRSGDHVVAQRNHYAATTVLFRDILPRFGVECTVVDQTNTSEFASAVRPNTKIIYTETPVNPLMQITDLRAIADLGRKHAIVTMCDNTFATPINQRPIELGIDVVLHSATKYIGGHHDVTAGAMIGTKAFIDEAWRFAVVSGSVLSPFDGWLLLRGLRTLGLRVERHNQNARALARFLEAHPEIERVYYPGLESFPQHELAKSLMSGFTGMLSVEVRGGYSGAEKLISSLKLATRAASLGGFETLVVHPAAMWSLQLSPEQQRATGISESLVRISVGLEDERDLVADFAQALDRMTSAKE
ncbi:MAG TPA: aminotransferase class I/II-fold pyridoxal phosphate-dependent enzyme [Blastocatellia bacterium]|nr:aminotransferase class I/II-fold pyridoxal phosphate-dependent enzyme [Blastocatellia bacterium]